MRKILLIGSVILMAVGLIVFLAIGTPLKNFACMWAGTIVFLTGVVVFIIYIFLKAFLLRKEKDKNNIQRGKGN